jgi:hypothetical protein
LVFYVYLFDTVYEGAVGDMGTEKKDENTPKPDSATGGISSTPSQFGISLTAPLSAPAAQAAPATSIPLATPLANPQEASQMEKMYSGQINMTQDSKSIPYEPVQNPYVQPSESMGNTKSTSNAISSPLMPAPASVTAPTMPI